MTLRERGWQLYDAIVATAARKDENPWHLRDGRLRYSPDTDTLARLLAVPIRLGAPSQSGVPALALDVWVSYEFRRAGFDADRVWPRATTPRVLPVEVTDFIGKLPRPEQARLLARVAVDGTGGFSSANILGKNYVKQVDVVMSSWATGPELLVSTKRMDSSFGKNAANRVEESYGDAKNLRLRYPQAALGFVYALNASALVREPDTAAWLIDLLGKLGREDDAYHAVALILPDLAAQVDPPEPDELPEAQPLQAGATELMFAEFDAGPQGPPRADLLAELDALAPVGLNHEQVPVGLTPARFFEVMATRILDNSPINFHQQARQRRQHPQGS